jgi:DNA polymerase-3 subunit delta
MMSQKKIVEVTPPNMGGWREKERKAFLDAIDGIADSPDTVLLVIAPRGTLDPGTAKKPAAFFRALSAHLTPVEFPYQTGVRLRRWVERHFARAEIAVSEDAMATLLSRCPQDMTGLSGEIEKLIAYCLANHMPAVTPEIVYRVTSPALREDAFALANAVVAGDRTAALAALDVHRKKKDDPILVLSGLSRVMSDLLTVSVMAEGGADKSEIARALRMHEYKVSLYIKSAKEFGTPRLAASLDRCRGADRMMKSSSGGGYMYLERLVCTIPRGGMTKSPQKR